MHERVHACMHVCGWVWECPCVVCVFMHMYMDVGVCVMVFVANSALSVGCDECVWICYTVGIKKINFAFRFTYRRIRNVRINGSFRSRLFFRPSVPFRCVLFLKNERC